MEEDVAVELEDLVRRYEELSGRAVELRRHL
jgi:hypothetical protein